MVRINASQANNEAPENPERRSFLKGATATAAVVAGLLSSTDVAEASGPLDHVFLYQKFNGEPALARFLADRGFVLVRDSGGRYGYIHAYNVGNLSGYSVSNHGMYRTPSRTYFSSSEFTRSGGFLLPRDVITPDNSGSDKDNHRPVTPPDDDCDGSGGSCG